MTSPARPAYHYTIARRHSTGPSMLLSSPMPLGLCRDGCWTVSSLRCWTAEHPVTLTRECGLALSEGLRWYELTRAGDRLGAKSVLDSLVRLCVASIEPQPLTSVQEPGVANKITNPLRVLVCAGMLALTERVAKAMCETPLP